MKFVSDSLMIVDSLKTNVATKLIETTNIISSTLDFRKGHKMNAFTSFNSTTFSYEQQTSEGKFSLNVETGDNVGTRKIPDNYLYHIEAKIDSVPVGSMDLRPNSSASISNIVLQSGNHKIELTWTNDYYDPTAGMDANINILDSSLSSGSTSTFIYFIIGAIVLLYILRKAIK